MEYCIYHDESQEVGYWHGILFIPKCFNDEVIDLLKQIRTDCGYHDYQRLNFKGLKDRGNKFKAISMSLQLFVLLIRRFIKPHIDGNSGNTIYRQASKGSGISCASFLVLNKVYGVKFMLLKEKDAHNKMDCYPDFASKIETTFRFALKGGCHFIFDNDNPICIKKIFFDGHQHYHRHIDKNRVIKNLQSEFRDYCTIDTNFDIDDRQLIDRKDESFVVMNFIDNIISAWRCLISMTYSNQCQKDETQILYNLFKRWQDGKIHKNSEGRWFKSFCLSECWLEDDQWNFDNFMVKNSIQPKLF